MYNDRGERVYKESDDNVSFYLNPHYTEKSDDAFKHILIGTTRLVTKEMNTDKPKELEHEQYYYHPDHLGSSSFVTDHEGKLKEHLEYFPFGETWIQEENSLEIAFKFTGKELDSETGLYYFGARYYDPRTSVWQSADPILGSYLNGQHNGGVFDSGHLALYTYVKNNPLIYTDPDGMAENVHIFIFDGGTRPSDNGKRGTSYGGVAYTYTTDGGKLHIGGPYRISTYANSVSNTNNTPATAEIKAKGLIQGGTEYNNQSGHKGGTKRGLNMGTTTVNSNGKATFERTVESTGPNSVHNNESIVTEGNIHAGASDNGNHNSRGSEACFTLHPDDTAGFMGEFDWNKGNKNTGTSHGKVFSYRGSSLESSAMRSMLELAKKNQHAEK